ncbi:hypothetical protein KKA27_02275 [Patescibacteria group bacterium]|nr:hypothetical protein [Patescibacteria group bacterium]MBU2633042.1 hypothetical protein [Patescibacteria group bacterium]
MTEMVSRTLSVHKEHEVLLKLETAGLTDVLAQRVIDSKSNDLATKVVRLIENGGYEATTSQKQAREIMGKNFFGIEEANKHFRVNPSKKEAATLAEVPFTEGVLESCKDTHTLVAIFSMSILEVRKVDNSLFYSSSGGWYESEKFAKNKGTVSWQLVRKTPVDDSMSKTWVEQQELLSKDEEAPSAQVMVYTIIGHYKNTGERLFKNVYIRTSCVGSGGSRVLVGGFDSGGLVVFFWWGGGRHSDLGLSSAQKF